MKTAYLKLTKEQRERGVVFSSQLFPGGTLHEITRDEWREDEEAARAKEARLRDVRFFHSSPFTRHEVKQ